MRSFAKIKSLQNDEKSFLANHAKENFFNLANMSFDAIRENKIFANISEFTV